MGVETGKVNRGTSRPVAALLTILAFLGAWALGGVALAEGGGTDSADPVGLTLEEKASNFINQGEPREAIDLLRGKADTRQRALLLARAYMDDGNDFWALRTLQGQMGKGDGDGDGDDWEPVLWIAFVLINQGALDDSVDLLDQLEVDALPAGSPDLMRWHLLQTLRALAAGEPGQAEQALRAAERERGHGYSEDREALAALRTSVYKNFIAPISGRMELGAGGTTNARAGSPVDPAETGDPPPSGLASITMTARGVLPTGWWLRPTVDAEVRGMGIEAPQARDLSWLQLSGRPGLLFGRSLTLLTGYRFEALATLGGDRYDEGPLWFYQAHRGEFEVEFGSTGLSLFGGGGHREFREMSRTRYEVDLGVGYGGSPVPRLRILGAVTGRMFRAHRDFYDLYGVTAVVHGQVQIHKGWNARVGAVGSVDDYLNSMDYFVYGDTRRDLLIKANGALWTPQSRAGFRGGLTYEWSKRMSTATDYQYVDHRVMLRGQWNFSSDPRDWGEGVSPASLVNHVALPWGLEQEQAFGALEDTIQDLLRQDEAVRAGSSCID